MAEYIARYLEKDSPYYIVNGGRYVSQVVRVGAKKPLCFTTSLESARRIAFALNQEYGNGKA